MACVHFAKASGANPIWYCVPVVSGGLFIFYVVVFSSGLFIYCECMCLHG
uniref:Transmembrane protein n=1 Tax=Anguilla anguilla TaxID=7936 RepID=A0A0E9RIM5_ANGAN